MEYRPGDQLRRLTSMLCTSLYRRLVKQVTVCRQAIALKHWVSSANQPLHSHRNLECLVQKHHLDPAGGSHFSTCLTYLAKITSRALCESCAVMSVSDLFLRAFDMHRCGNRHPGEGNGQGGWLQMSCIRPATQRNRDQISKHLPENRNMSPHRAGGTERPTRR